MTAAQASTRTSSRGFILPAVALTASLGGIAWVGDLNPHNLGYFYALFTIAALAYAWSVIRLRRAIPATAVLWVVAIALRLALLLQPPFLSSDIHRYLWDGHLMASGVNPYLAAVNNPLLDAFSVPARDAVQHAWMASPYLPAAQGYFGLLTRLAPGSALAFQVAAAGMDLAVGWLVWRWLPRLGLPAAAALIYLWNPLAALEFAQGAHVDAWMLLLTLAALWFSLEAGGDPRRAGVRQTLSVLFLAGAALVKGTPLLLAPLLLPRWGWHRTLLFMALIIAPLAGFAAGASWGVSGAYDGVGVFGALRIYASFWQFNPGFFAISSGLLRSVGLPAETAGQAARLLSGAMMAAIVGWGALVARRLWAGGSPHAEAVLSMLRLCLLTLMASLLLAPTLHPWYVTLILPLLAFLWGQASQRLLLAAGMWLSLAGVYSYGLYFAPPGWLPTVAIALVTYVPTFALLAAWAWQARVRTKGSLTSINHTQLGGDTR